MIRKVLRKSPFILAYFYLVLPIVIFVLGWMKWYWALPITVIVVVSLVLAIKSIPDITLMEVNKNSLTKLAIAFVLICIWVLFSGIGGLTYQTSDHEYRTAIYRALVEYEWPVLSASGEKGLIYYIAFWMPAALIGKIFGFQIGYWFQCIWAVLGITLVYFLMCVRSKKITLLPLLFLIFFSGMDYFGWLILGREGNPILTPIHIEWWVNEYEYTSNTSQLYWVFNQCIPAWIATILIVTERNKRNVLFITSLIMFSSTFPFVGLIPFAMYVILDKFRISREQIKKVFTFQNIIGAGTICLLFLVYLSGNVSANNVSGDMGSVQNAEVYTDFSGQIIRYLLFVFLEVGVYLIFIFKQYKRTIEFYIVIAILLICPFIIVGSSHDFCMRVSIPALFVLMLYCMDSLEKAYVENKKRWFYMFSIFLIVGAITPFNEIHMSVRETITRYENQQSSKMPEVDIEETMFEAPNFYGFTTESIFYKYMAKNVDLEKQSKHLSEIGILQNEKDKYFIKNGITSEDNIEVCEPINIEDASDVIKRIERSKRNLLISEENLVKIISKYPEKMAQIISKSYICEKDFDSNLFFRYYKKQQVYSAANILVLPYEGVEIENGKCWGTANAEFMIFNPYPNVITADLRFLAKIRATREADVTSFKIYFNGNEINTSMSVEYLTAENELVLKNGISFLEIELNEMGSRQLTYYRIDKFNFKTEYIYDDISVEANSLVIVESEKVPFVNKEIIVNAGQKSEYSSVISRIKKSKRDHLVISADYFVELINNNIEEMNEIFGTHYHFSYQESDYLVFEYIADDNEYAKQKAIVPIVYNEKESRRHKALIYYPFADELSVRIVANVERASDLLDSFDILSIMYGSKVEEILFNNEQETIKLKVDLEPGLNEIHFVLNDLDYTFSDGIRCFFTLLDVTIAEVVEES